jgi:hypothetical protein
MSLCLLQNDIVTYSVMDMPKMQCPQYKPNVTDQQNDNRRVIFYVHQSMDQRIQICEPKNRLVL